MLNIEANNPALGSPMDQATQQELGSPQTDEREISAEVDQGEGEPQPVDDSEEIEHEGQKYRVPKAVKPLLMLHSDYTRKTQELAERARGFDSERETFTKSAHAERQLLAEGREVVALDWQIEQLKAVDFAALQQSDPNRAQQLFWQLTQLQGMRDSKARELQQQIAHRQSQSERQSANRRDQAQAVLARDVEGWSPELQSKLAAFAMSPELGFTANELAQVEDPRIVKLLHLAHLGQQAVHKLKAAGAPAAPQPTPTRTVGNSSPAAKNPDRMSTEEWMNHRKSQLRKQRN